MKRVLAFVLGLGALGLAPLAGAELKIAVVDVQAAIGQTQEAQSFLEKVQESLEADLERIRELTAQRAEIEEKVQRDAEVMGEEERTRLSEDYERITSDLQYRTETYQKAVNRRRNELFQKMGPGVQAALDDLVKLEAYDLVLPRNTVIYVNPKHDTAVGALAALILTELWSHPSRSVELAVLEMTKGAYATRFWLGGVFCGLVIPLLANSIALATDGNTSIALTAVAGASALVGLFCYEDAYVRAGQSVPLS